MADRKGLTEFILRSKRQKGFRFTINLNNIYFQPKVSIRAMSTLAGQKPVRIYLNPYKQRDTIINENRELSGVYR